MYIRITKYNMYICIYVLQNIKYHVYIYISVCWSGLTQSPKKKKTPQLSFHPDGTNLFTYYIRWIIMVTIITTTILVFRWCNYPQQHWGIPMIIFHIDPPRLPNHWAPEP